MTNFEKWKQEHNNFEKPEDFILQHEKNLYCIFDCGDCPCEGDVCGTDCGNTFLQWANKEVENINNLEECK